MKKPGHTNKILIVDNRASDLATNDDEFLEELSNLESTGFNEGDLRKLLGEFASDEGEELSSRFEVVVECPDNDAQQEIFDRLTGEGWSCRVLSL
ncbi:hypothetical protein [Streptomyces coeruleorubidus]|uniref:hypothetical protein n=1 Tax=Streptomyces coeruleorubidus TaxID=116188 RepID=UPI00369B6986